MIDSAGFGPYDYKSEPIHSRDENGKPLCAMQGGTVIERADHESHVTCPDCKVIRAAEERKRAAICKVHILTTTDTSTNGRVESVWLDKEDAQARFMTHFRHLARLVGDHDPEMITSDEMWSYRPDDTEDHENESIVLYLDCEVQS